LRRTARTVVAGMIDSSPTANHTSCPALHDALPILAQALQAVLQGGSAVVGDNHGADGSRQAVLQSRAGKTRQQGRHYRRPRTFRDRKSTRLNSSHVKISYAVFCLKKKILWRHWLPA